MHTFSFILYQLITELKKDVILDYCKSLKFSIMTSYKSLPFKKKHGDNIVYCSENTKL